MKHAAPYAYTGMNCVYVRTVEIYSSCLICRRYLDWIGLMSYDMEYSSKGVTKHHSPLFPREDEPAGDKKLCIVGIFVNVQYPKGRPQLS